MIRMITLAALVMALALGSTAAAQAQDSPAASKAAPAKAPAAASTVNLNSATMAQLEALPGIGAAVAQRILEYRQQNGGFKKVEDLMNVRGVGEKSFLRIRPLVTVK